MGGSRSPRRSSSPPPRKRRSRSRSPPPRKDEKSSAESSATMSEVAAEKKSSRRRSGWSSSEASESQTETKSKFSGAPSPSNGSSSNVGLLFDETRPNSLAALCRIYVGSLDYALSEEDIRQVFSPFGHITNVDMPKEGPRSKGFCFVEYSTPDAAEMALHTMQGFNLKGRSIKVGRPTALGAKGAAFPGANFSLMTPETAVMGGGFNPLFSTAPSPFAPAPAPSVGAQSASRIFVGSIPASFTANDVKEIFNPFGTIVNCTLIPSTNNPGTHREYGFIEYQRPEQAKLAVETMNNFDMAGRCLRVASVTSLRNAAGSIPQLISTKFFGTQPPPDALGEVAAAQGFSSTPPAPTVPVGDSPIILLSNMINDISELDDEFREEVRVECENYGKVKKVDVKVLKDNDIRAFITYSKSCDALAAVPALNDRWFGGRQIKCRQYDTFAYEAQNYRE